MRRTTSHAEALLWAQEVAGPINVAKYWIPEIGFRDAVRGDHWVGLSREGNEIYALAIGDNPEIDPAWQTFSLPKSTPREKSAQLQITGQWAAYYIESIKCAQADAIEIITDGDEIETLLTTSAPDSSVHPGNPEVIFWGGIRSADGTLIAVGALTRWQSGGIIISSIATHKDYRRQGFGRAVTAGIVRMAHDQGIEHVVLAVFAKNSSARALYESLGFALMGEFNHFSR